MTKDDLNTGTAAVRNMINQSGYGSFVSDEQCQAFAYTVIDAVDKRRSVLAPKPVVVTAPTPVVTPTPVPQTLPQPAHVYFHGWGDVVRDLLKT